MKIGIISKTYSNLTKTKSVYLISANPNLNCDQEMPMRKGLVRG